MTLPCASALVLSLLVVVLSRAQASRGDRSNSLLQKSTKTVLVASAPDIPEEPVRESQKTASASDAPATQTRSSLALLKSALKEDPSNSASIGFDLSGGGGKAGFCHGHACAQPSCAEAGRELHPYFDTGLACGDQQHRMEVATENRSEWETNSMLWDSVLQAGSDGKLCQVCPERRTGSVSFILDQTAYTEEPASMADCELVGTDVSPSKPDYDTYGAAMFQDGRLQFASMPLTYEYAGRQHQDGRLVYAVIWPNACPSGGCQTLLYLHGIKPHLYETLYPDYRSMYWVEKIAPYMFQALCDDAYKSLKSVILIPFLDNITFPAADEVFVNGKTRDYYDEHPNIANLTWYNTYVDIFESAVLPVLHKFQEDFRDKLDVNRVHLTGVSMGAVGTVLGALKHPEEFLTATAFSPCNQPETGFTDMLYEWADRITPIWSKSNILLRRLLMFVGQGDNSYRKPEGGATCANALADFFEYSQLSSHSMDSFVAELRYLPNRQTVSENGTVEIVEMTHLGTVSAGMAQMDAILWTAEEDMMMLPFLAPSFGCSPDLTWLPIVMLLFLLVAYETSDMCFKAVRGPSPAAMDVVVGSPRSIGGGSRLHTAGFITTKARSIPTLPELLAKSSEGVAIRNTKEGATVTYAALHAYLASEEVAAALPHGLRYAVLLPAGHSLACALLAVMHFGTAVPLDPAMTEQELSAACVQLKVQAVVSAAGSVGEVAGAVANNLGLVSIVCEQSASGSCPTLKVAAGSSFPKPAQPWDPTDETRVVLILRTSGTTSKGKVVPFSFTRLVRAAQYNATCVGLEAGEVCLSMMPLYHIAGISVNLLPSLFAGATVLILGGAFDVNHFIEQLERGPERAPPTWYFAVPSVHASVISEAERLGRPLNHSLRLIRSAGAALDPRLGRKMVRFFGASVTPCYGMTEACEITCPPKDYKADRDGSVGPAMTCEIKIDNSKEPSNMNGEVCVKGDMLMKSYEWDGAAEDDPNLEAWTKDGYLRTGDVGHLDSDGWLYLTGRSKEMINRGGETLSPYEVEDALQAMPGISLCLSFAAPHASLGECIAVACVLQEGKTPVDVPLSAILEECAKRGLRPVMRPEVVIYAPREALPMTRTKKYIRAGLAGKLGLTDAELLESSRAFQYKAGSLQAVPEAGLNQDAGLILQDSMGQLQTATRTTFITQNVVNAMYGICIINVMLNHWLPHDLSDYPMQRWTKDLFTAFRSDKALMGLVFALGGHSAANWDKSSFGTRIIAFISIYIFMGWPHLWLATEGVATFHRWFIYWLVVCVAAVHGLETLKVDGFFPVLVAFSLAPALSDIPDDLGSHLVPSAPFLMDPYHFWSMGHKMYWFGFFCLGYYYGHFIPELVENATSVQKDFLQNVRVRLAALVVACLLAWSLVSLDVPHDDTLEDSLADWPFFFNPWYPVKMLAEWLQLMCLVVAVQQGNSVLRTVGANILGTFIVHMYLDTGIKTFAESKMFQDVDFCPFFGGLLQFIILIAYPVIFALTVGRFTMCLFVLAFSRMSARSK